MSKGTFQDRLAAAISSGDTVIIKHSTNEMDEHDYLEISVEKDTKEWGILRQSEQLFIHAATPGRLVSCIEKASNRILMAIETIAGAQVFKTNS